MMMPESPTVYLYAGITDMRKSINTLAILVQEEMNMEVIQGALFLFRSRCARKMKALYYEDGSYTLWYRRLESGKFIFPRNASGTIELEQQHFEWLLASNKYSRPSQFTPENHTDFY